MFTCGRYLHRAKRRLPWSGNFLLLFSIEVDFFNFLPFFLFWFFRFALFCFVLLTEHSLQGIQCPNSREEGQVREYTGTGERAIPGESQPGLTATSARSAMASGPQLETARENCTLRKRWTQLPN